MRLLMATVFDPAVDDSIEAEPVTVEVEGDTVRLGLDDGMAYYLPRGELVEALSVAHGMREAS